MDDSDSKEYTFHTSKFDWEDKNNPKDTDGWQENGQKYYEKFLQPVLPGLESIVHTLQEEISLSDEETACIFLDRDSRPAMHAFRERIKHRRLKTFPIPLSGAQVHQFVRDTYTSFELNAILDGIHDPDQWSQQFAEEYGKIYKYDDWMQQWVAAIRESHGKKLADTRLIVLVDIGYHGSMLEIARCMLEKAFPGITIRTVLLYKYSDNIPIRAVVSNDSSQYAEDSIPHTTVGYTLKGDRYRYLKGTPESVDHKAEDAFYRGVIQAAHQDVSPSDSS